MTRLPIREDHFIRDPTKRSNTARMVMITMAQTASNVEDILTQAKMEVSYARRR
jgi:hypothetical protein